MLSPGETIGFDSLIANQNKNIFYDYTTGELVINSTGNFLARIKLVHTSPFNVTLSSGTVQAGLVLTQIY